VHLQQVQQAPNLMMTILSCDRSEGG